ncbi:MAG TPA: aminotransferase class V-fold PLP-dependent enzyme [Acidimicrobiales bacterium]
MDDPLRSFRDEFVVPDPGLVYFDGNSLGRLPRRTVTRLATLVGEEWGSALVRSWPRWMDLPLEVGDRLGAAVLGAATGQVVVCDSTTVNLYKAAAAALDVRPDRRTVVIAPEEFPTDRYVLQGLARSRGLSLGSSIGDDVALVVRSLVDYRTGELADAAGITATAHESGAMVLWDLSHAAGSVPADLDRWGVDLAVGCGYKYLNGGPGAPAWLYVRADLQDELRPPVWGWMGHQEPFAMGDEWEPAAGMRRWLAGTPPIAGIVAVDCGVAMLAEAGMDRVRAKGMALTSLAAGLAEAWLEPLGFSLASPADPAKRGSHIALRHPEAMRLSRALIEGAEVVPDYRPPDLLRIGLAPLTTTFTEVWDGFDRIRAVAAEKGWEGYDRTPGRVT